MSKTMIDHARRMGPALERMYQFQLWLVSTVEKFPRRAPSQRPQVNPLS